MLEFGIGHLLGIHCQVISQHNFQLFGAYVSAAVSDLATVGTDVCWFFTVLMAELTENLGHFITFVFSHIIFSFFRRVPFDGNLSLYLTSCRVQASMVFRILSSFVACEELDLRKGS